MIYFIPIKENSQRVPGKNFRNLFGEPLYKHTLLKFKNELVYVDTDSKKIYNEIKNDSRLKNINVFYREKELIGDEVSVCDLIYSFICKYKINDFICQIHVTSPFLDKETIVDAHSFLGDQNDSIVSCNKINSRLWRSEKYGVCPVNHNPLRLEQTQDLPTIFEENSCFYIFHSNTFKINKNRVGVRPYFYEMLFPYNLDIDTEDDWTMCVKISKLEI